MLRGAPRLHDVPLHVHSGHRISACVGTDVVGTTPVLLRTVPSLPALGSALRESTARGGPGALVRVATQCWRV